MNTRPLVVAFTRPHVLLCVALLAWPAAAQGGILSLSPSSVTAGSPTFTLTVNGIGFASGNVLQWDGNNLATTFVSSTQLTTSISSAFLLVGGTHQIRNKVNATQNNFSNTVIFTILNPTPAITSLNPTTAAAGASAFTLQVTGTGYNSQSVVRWNGTALPTTFGSSVFLTAQVGASLLAVGDAAQVTVLNPTPGGGTSGAQIFPVTNPAPTLSTVSPNTIFASASPTTLTVNGANFNASTVIRLDGSPVPTTLVSATQATTAIDTTQVPPGTHAVSVQNPAPGGGTTFSLNVLIVIPTPQITSISPAVIVGGGASQTLTINGSGFFFGTQLAAAGFPLPLTAHTATQITTTIPQNLLHSTSVLPVTVANAGPIGGGLASTSLTIAGPALQSVTPAFLPVLSAGSLPITLTIGGASFASGDLVRINGVPRTTTFVNANTLTCTVDGTVAAATVLGGFGVTVTHGALVSNGLSVTVGSAGFPANDGVVTLGPVPPAPGQLFDIRVELPVSLLPIPLTTVPVTLIVDTASPSPFILAAAPGFGLAVGPGLGSPIVIVDGVGVFGPATPGALTHAEDLSAVGVTTFRSIFRTSAITAPPPLGVTVSLAAVYADIDSPISLNVTQVSGPYAF